MQAVMGAVRSHLSGIQGITSRPDLLDKCRSGNENLQRWPLAQVSNSEMSNFSQNQENQGIARRRIDRTPHKQSRTLTRRLRKRAISGWALTKVLSQRREELFILQLVDKLKRNLSHRGPLASQMQNPPSPDLPAVKPRLAHKR